MRSNRISHEQTLPNIISCLYTTPLKIPYSDHKQFFFFLTYLNRDYPVKYIFKYFKTYGFKYE